MHSDKEDLLITYLFLSIIFILFKLIISYCYDHWLIQLNVQDTKFVITTSARNIFKEHSR